MMHMRIRHHFLADLHVTRHARETEGEKRIRNTQNKACGVELVTSPNRDYRPYATPEHTFFLYTIDEKSRRILLNSIISRGEK